jgi:hypothetical protein
MYKDANEFDVALFRMILRVLLICTSIMDGAVKKCLQIGD